jgi:hypothetical protein
MMDLSYHKRLDSDRYSSKWSRETKMSSIECARLLYEEIEALMHDNAVFHGQYNLLMNHYRQLSREVMAA